MPDLALSMKDRKHAAKACCECSEGNIPSGLLFWKDCRNGDAEWDGPVERGVVRGSGGGAAWAKMSMQVAGRPAAGAP